MIILPKIGSTIKTTKRSSGCNPAWNEEFEFPIDYAEGQSIRVDIFDSDKLSDDEHLGSVELNVDNIRSSVFQDGWFDLDNTSKIRMRTSWLPVGEQVNTSNKMSKILSIFVGKIKNKSCDNNEKLSLRVDIETDKDRKSSKVVEENEEGEFIFSEGFMLIMRQSEQQFCLKIMDAQDNSKICQKFFSMIEDTMGQVLLEELKTEQVIKSK